MVDTDDLCDLFPIKAYDVSRNLTLYNSEATFFSFDDRVVIMKANSAIAIVDGIQVQLGEKDRIIPYKEKYSHFLVPLETILSLLGIDYKIENDVIEADFNAYSNPSASDIFNFDEVLLVKDGKTYEGTQSHILYFEHPKLQGSMKEYGVYRIVGYYSSIEPEHVFVKKVEEWLP